MATPSNRVVSRRPPDPDPQQAPFWPEYLVRFVETSKDTPQRKTVCAAPCERSRQNWQPKRAGCATARENNEERIHCHLSSPTVGSAIAIKSLSMAMYSGKPVTYCRHDQCPTATFTSQDGTNAIPNPNGKAGHETCQVLYL